MGEIYLNNNGDGYTYCIPAFGTNLSNGESFTVYFNPDAGATIDAVFATDSYDYSIALPQIVNNQFTMNWRNIWRNMYLEVYYSGSPTPPPTPPAPRFDIMTLILLKKRLKNRRFFKF